MRSSRATLPNSRTFSRARRRSSLRLFPSRSRSRLPVKTTPIPRSPATRYAPFVTASPQSTANAPKGASRIRYLDNPWLLPLVTGSLLPLAQPLGGDSLLPLDVLGDVGECPQALPQRDRPAGEKGCQRTTDQEDHQHLHEVSRL